VRISVVIPTYARPEGLVRCLAGLARQTRPPDEILVVVRRDDETTAEALADVTTADLQSVLSERPGQVAALNAGIARAGGDIIAITDDDAVPRADWLERVESHFIADPEVGGVGGRDWVHDRADNVDARSNRRVGKVQWIGRVVGNHHIGVGPPRDVDILKGANMSYRTRAIADLAFDERLRGDGAQPGNDLAFSLRVRRAGWRIVYDPRVAVDHYPAPRPDDPRSGSLPPTSVETTVHNQALALLDYLPRMRRIAFLGWAVLVGTRDSPGGVQALRILVMERRNPIPTVTATLRGLWAAARTWRRSQRGLAA
jgi:GT2 family glycosyltransferase